jgi:lysophospholipase L1-like esterase
MIHIGGIDTLSFTRFQKMEKFFVKMNNHIQRLKINTVILVTVNNVGLSPFICFPFKGIYSTRSKKMHHFFQKIAQIYSMVHISLYALPGNDPLAKNPSRLFAGDRIHPNDEGYGIWYSKIKEVIPTYLV